MINCSQPPVPTRASSSTSSNDYARLIVMSILVISAEPRVNVYLFLISQRKPDQDDKELREES
jgi:hypothetical protein